MTAHGSAKAPDQLNVFGNVCTLYANGITTLTLYPNDEFLGADALAQIGEYLPDGFDSEQQREAVDKTGERFVGCRLRRLERSDHTPLRSALLAPNCAQPIKGEARQVNRPFRFLGFRQAHVKQPTHLLKRPAHMHGT